MSPHPGGRPHLLTPEQEQAVFERIVATRRGRRCFVYSRLARELDVGVSTLERIVTRKRRERFAAVVERFVSSHPHNSVPGEST